MKPVLLLSLLCFGLGCASSGASSSEGGHEDIIPNCQGDGTAAQNACVAVTTYLESYGCTFSATCDAICEDSDVVCAEDIHTCELEAESLLSSAAPEDLDAACQEITSYCASILVCRPLN